MDYSSLTTSDSSAAGPTENVEIGPPWLRSDESVLDYFKGYSTANIGDASGRLGMPDGGLTPLWDGCRAVGNALTVLTVAGDNLAVIEAVRHVRPGDLLVVNGFGYQGRAILGDLLAGFLQSRGAVGAIVDGAVRDQEEIRRQGFPVWCRAVSPAGPWKAGPGGIGVPVAIGGVVVSAGDIVVADADGIVAVPHAKAAGIAVELERVAAFESEMRQQAQESGTGHG